MHTAQHPLSSLLARLLPLVLLLGLAGTSVEEAHAQHPTSVTSILNGESTPDTTLEINHNGSLLAPGSFSTSTPNDSIPAEGAGTRLMWYPAKAAFRVGRVSGSQWDDSNVGDHSLALGENTEASDSYATAIGGKTTASDFGSTAMGYRTTASASHATAVNYRTEAATSESLSIGECNNANTSSDGTLFVAGNGTFGGLGFCTRSDALVLDKDAGFLVNGALGTGSIPATGSGTRLMWYPGKAAFRAGRVDGTQWDDGNVGKHSAAFGENVKASGRKAFAAGFNANATDVETIALGKNVNATGTQAVAIGQGADADGSSATALGSNTNAGGVGALAANRDTDAGADASTALGRRTSADTPHSLSIGQCNSANQTDDQTLFVVGNGTLSSGVCSVDDALVLDESGNLTVNSQNTFSDRRLKRNIEPLEAGILQKLGEVRPVRYEFKDQETHPSGEQIGLIAQNVRKAFPSLVHDGPNGYLSLAYPKLTAVLLKGIQEQEEKLNEQQSQIADLKAENDAIKERLAALEATVSADDPALASLAGPWVLALLLGLGLGGVGAGLVYRRA